MEEGGNNQKYFFFFFFQSTQERAAGGEGEATAELGVHGSLVRKRRDAAIPPLVTTKIDVNNSGELDDRLLLSSSTLLSGDLRFLRSNWTSNSRPRRRSLNLLKGTCRSSDASKYDDDVSEQQAAVRHGPHQLARAQVLTAFLLVLHVDFQCTLVLLVLPTQQHHHQQQRRRRQQLGGDAPSLSPNPTGTYSA